MGRKRPHEQEDGSVLKPKKVKLEISSDLNEEFEQVVEHNDASYEKKPKKKDKKKLDRYEDAEQYTEETTEAHPRKEYRRKARGMNLSRVKEILDFEEAKNMILTNPNCGLKVSSINS
ncbi:hypothetical protein TELCIR_11157 [Teladorsagia circumcincta]|uniref:Uncharacterized protein n=1 Tax=Teladorsagia circumcincta TaxID=45464 RepID=A0A2G9UA70_TELCI|nr:hypothetical protein TELCIR_11157 [Teladorsagia circumcincta]